MKNERDSIKFATSSAILFAMLLQKDAEDGDSIATDVKVIYNNPDKSVRKMFRRILDAFLEANFDYAFANAKHDLDDKFLEDNRDIIINYAGNLVVNTFTNTFTNTTKNNNYEQK